MMTYLFVSADDGAITQDDHGYSSNPVEEISHDIDTHEAVPLWADTATWVLVPVLIVVALFIWKGVPKMIGKALDDRAVKIGDELEQARTLREEAQELLASYKRRQREAEEEAQGIISQAKIDAKRIAAEAREKIDAQMARRTAAAEDKIARAEAQAIAEVRGKTAELSAAAAEAIIRTRLDGNASSQLVDKAIGDVRSKLN